jgi:phosphatidylinositol-3-phosphatase
MTRRAWLSLVLGAFLLTSCGGASSSARATPSANNPSRSPTPSPSPSSGPQRHVFVIVMENRSYQQAMAQPYVASLAAKYAVATNYHAVAHPSVPNYLAITSGSTWGIADDGFHPLPNQGLAAELTEAGVPWRAYMEGFTGNCFTSPYPYALKHDPFAYYGDQCPSTVVPMSQLTQDLAGSTPQLSWVGPGLCNDGHDCSAGVADRWLATVVPQITASSAWKANGILYITWDESDADGANLVPLIVVAPHLQTHTTSAYLDHLALVATIADHLGVARPGGSTSAPSIAQAFGLAG